MIPGPVEVDPEVLKAMGSQVQPHYGAAWMEKYSRVRTRLKDLFGITGEVFIMTGSGTAAIDACLGSSLSTGEKVIIGNNGFFGDRLVSIAQGNGLDVVQVKAEWGKRLLPADFEKAIQKNPDAKMIALVHCETSTAVLNPIEEIGPIARKHGMLCFVDAVSAFGGVQYSLDEWQIDLCATASQKCLGAPPGLAPVALNERAWEMIDRKPSKAHGWYTDLRVWRQYSIDWGDWHPTPITMATSIVSALTVNDFSNNFGTEVIREDFIFDNLLSVSSIVSMYPIIQCEGQMEIQIGSKYFQGESTLWQPAVIYNPASSKKVDVRTTGVYHSWKFSSIGNTPFTLSGFTLYYANNGKR